jgi:hypothetical protein
MFDFSQDDLMANQAGRISARQQEWLAQMARTTNRWGGATLWVGLFFMMFAVCLILSLFMMNEDTQKVLASASPMLAAAVCFVFLAIILFSFLGKRVTQKQAEQIVHAEFLTAEGTAKLGETFNPRWGSGYYLEIGETRFAVDARNKFEEGKQYRVYYGRIPDGNLIFSYEKIS